MILGEGPTKEILTDELSSLESMVNYEDQVGKSILINEKISDLEEDRFGPLYSASKKVGIVHDAHPNRS